MIGAASIKLDASDYHGTGHDISEITWAVNSTPSKCLGGKNTY